MIGAQLATDFEEGLLQVVSALLPSGGSLSPTTTTVIWNNATNPEAWTVPWDCALLRLALDSGGIWALISTQGLTMAQFPSGKRLELGAVAFNVNAPWNGFWKIARETRIYLGGSAANMNCYLTFAIFG
jgi:hypothetical protein